MGTDHSGHRYELGKKRASIYMGNQVAGSGGRAQMVQSSPEDEAEVNVSLAGSTWVAHVDAAPCSSAGCAGSRGPWKAQHRLGKEHVSLGIGNSLEQLLWHSQVGHGLKIPRKAGDGRQAPTPGRGTTPAKARPRGTRMLQLVLWMRKKRWWPLREGAGGCLSCRTGCSAHLRPGLVLQESWLLFAMHH